MALELRCDQYTATVPADGGEVLDWICRTAPMTESIELGPDGSIPAYRYSHARPIRDGKTTIAVVRWGGNGGANTSIELKGSIAEETYRPLRDRWPMHACSMLHVAADFAAEGLFDDADRALKAIAAANRPPVITRPEGAGWNHPGMGRSTYFGSKESDAHAILYDKSAERIERGGLHPSTVLPNWVRLEAKIHPKKAPTKKLLGRLSMTQALGLARWVPPMFEAFAGIKAEPVELPKRVRDDDRTYAALIAQYGRWIETQASDKGAERFIHELLRDAARMREFRYGRAA